MVADFWGVETRGAGLRACAASTDYCVGLTQDGAHESLESTGRRGWHVHPPWSHLEGGTGV